MDVNKNKHTLLVLLVPVFIIVGLFIADSVIANSRLKKESNKTTDERLINKDESVILNTTEPVQEEIPFVATHIETPASVKAAYMTAWVAGTPSLRDKLITLIDTKEFNSVVIDIKDATGMISYTGSDPAIISYGTYTNRIRNITDLIAKLHEKNIYVIGRISVFQDPKMTSINPDEAVQNRSDNSVWKDHKGLSFMDVQSHKHWEYISKIAVEAHNLGFDEINLDYVRFPTDGKIAEAKFPISKEPLEGETKMAYKTRSLEQFFKYVDTNMRKENGLIISADVFGLTTTATDDLGIGQTFAAIAPYVDYICPMIYPSHYAKGFNGFANPAEHPKEVITIANAGAIKKLTALGLPISKLRPWLQDFNMGATYTASMVRDQITATESLGINSWLMWDPKNAYTDDAYLNQ